MLVYTDWNKLYVWKNQLRDEQEKETGGQRCQKEEMQKKQAKGGNTAAQKGEALLQVAEPPVINVPVREG